MKKYLLTSALFAAFGLSATAQTRLSLYEEFSGENCPPCAAVNPGLWALINGTANQSKVIMIKYQSPIPSAGPIYNIYKIDTDARLAYYGVRFAPWGNMDGKYPMGLTPNANNTQYNPGSLTQTHINNNTAVASNFNITTTHDWYANGDSVRINVSVTAVNAHTGSNVKLRTALVETLEYDVAPGTNGETEFHNVVRKMYPSAAGTQSLNTWTANQTQTYTLEGATPSYVDKQGKVFVVVWLQDDNGKAVLQASQSAPVPVPNDLQAISTVVKSIACENAQYSYKLNIKNVGTSNVTTAELGYSLNGTNNTYNYTGNLTPGASQEITLGNVNLTNGLNEINATVNNVNGQSDFNAGNNNVEDKIYLYSTPVTSLPITFDFNTATLPTGWNILNNNLGFNAGDNDWRILKYNGTVTKDGSAAYASAFNYVAPGYSSYIVLPYVELAAGPKVIEFDYSYAMRGSLSDKLEVVYSTDCGTTWTAIWSKEGNELATAPASASNSFAAPTSTSHWKTLSIDASVLSGKSLVAVRTVTNGASYVFVDNVNLRNGVPTSTNDISYFNEVNLYPNPAKGNLTLKINTQLAADANVVITNLLGQQVMASKSATLSLGNNEISFDVSALNSGIYLMSITTEAGTFSKKFTKN